MDFTLKKYKQLLEAIGSGDYRLIRKISRGNILRHDVDKSLQNALIMAELESRLGIKTTYYFRVPATFSPAIINQIYNLGHEIGFHYECLDKAKGDYKKAVEIFEREWKLFRKWNSKTICMHGNPLSKFDNRDLWKKHDFKKFGIKAEAYLSVDFSKIDYFTDTGRAWNKESASVKDKTGEKLMQIKNTDQLISLIKNKKLKNFYILAHSCRWNDNFLLWLKELLWQNTKNIGKKFLK